MRVGQHLAGVLAGPAGHAGGAQQLHHLEFAALAGPALDQRVVFLAVLPAARRRLEARVVELRQVHHAPEALIHLRLAEDIDIVVRAAGRASEGGARHGLAELVAAPGLHHALALVVAQADAQYVDHRLLHGDLDLLALARLVALLERGEQADGEVHAGAGIADGGPGVGRRVVGEAGDAHRPAHGLRDGLEGLVAGVRPVAAEALDGAVDEAGIDLGEHVVAEAEPVQRARREILDQHVHFRDQLPEQRLAVPGLEVERQALLVGVQHQEEQPVLARYVGHGPAGGLAPARLLQLDDLGAEPGQHLRAGGARLVVGHVDDPDAVQGRAHGGRSFLSSLPGRLCSPP